MMIISKRQAAALPRRMTHQGVRFCMRYVEGATIPTITLFTGEHCSLCDEVKDVLNQCSIPYRREEVDIGEKQHLEYYRRYKWDIPVVWIDGKFFAKHRVELPEVEAALGEALKGEFIEREGEPDSRGMTWEG